MAEQAQILSEQYPQAFIIWNYLGVANLSLRKLSDDQKPSKK